MKKRCQAAQLCAFIFTNMLEKSFLMMQLNSKGTFLVLFCAFPKKSHLKVISEIYMQKRTLNFQCGGKIKISLCFQIFNSIVIINKISFKFKFIIA